MVHEAVQDRAAHGGIAQIFAPVLDHAVRGDNDGAAQLVAPVDDGLEQLGAHLGNAPGQKEIVQDEQIRVRVGAQNLGLFCRGGQPELRKVAVGFDVLDAVALQGCLVRHCLGDMAFTGAGFANDQGVGALGDEFEGVQLEARLPGNLGVEAPVKVSQAGAFIESGLFEPALCQTRTAPIEFVLQHGGKGVEEGLLGALGLHDTGVQGGGNAGQAQFAQGAFDLSEGHGNISVKN